MANLNTAVATPLNASENLPAAGEHSIQNVDDNKFRERLEQIIVSSKAVRKGPKWSALLQGLQQITDGK